MYVNSSSIDARYKASNWFLEDRKSEFGFSEIKPRNWFCFKIETGTRKLGSALVSK